MSTTPDGPPEDHPESWASSPPSGQQPPPADWSTTPATGAPYSYGAPPTPPGHGAPSGQQPGAAESTPTYTAPSGGFFHALFDLTFSRFVTVSFAKLIYIIAIAVIAVGYLLAVIGSLAAEPTRGVVVLLVGWVPALVYVIVVRVGLELAVAIVKTAQNTSALAGRQG